MIESSMKFTSRNDRSQIVDYNNPLFYCFAEKNALTSNALYMVPEHWHEDIEYFYVIEGKMEYSVNGESILLSAGEGICVNSRRIHSNKSVRGEYCIFYCVIIHPSYLCASPYIEEKYVAPVLGTGSFDYLLLRKDDWTVQILKEIEQLFAKPGNGTLELEIIEASFRILRLLYTRLGSRLIRRDTPVQYAGTFKRMVTFIQNHYREKVSLEEIAEAGNVGKTLCARIFRKFTTKTPGEYLIHYRISKGLELLRESDLSVTDISYAVGFNSASHFTKTFKELMGCTPNKCRETAGGGLTQQWRWPAWPSQYVRTESPEKDKIGE